MRVSIYGLLVAALVAGAAAAQQAVAPQPSDAIVMIRQQAMDVNNTAYDLLNAFARGTVPFDQATVQSILTVVAGNVEHFPNLFPDSTQQSTSHALPAVWSNKATFVAMAAKTASDAKAAIADATSANGLRASKAFADMKAGCTACHTQFRDF